MTSDRLAERSVLVGVVPVLTISIVIGVTAWQKLPLSDSWKVAAAIVGAYVAGLSVAVAILSDSPDTALEDRLALVRRGATEVAVLGVAVTLATSAVGTPKEDTARALTIVTAAVMFLLASCVPLGFAVYDVREAKKKADAEEATAAELAPITATLPLSTLDL